MSDTDRNDPASGGGDGGGHAEITPEMIEKFRQTGIRLDARGRLWHEGAEITHPGLRRAILSWLDVRDEDQRPIIRLDQRRYAYIDVDDAHLLITSLRWEGDRAIVTLNDGSEEELAYDTLEVTGDDAVYCRVRDGRLTARVTTPAHHKLAERIEQSDRGGFVLVAAGHRFDLAQR